MPERHDVVVIGGGMGGYVCAIRAAQLGLRTALVERDKVGGTCLHRGCIPTKALLQSAFLLDQVRHGEALGVRAPEVSLDYPTVARRRDAIVGQLHKGVEFLLRKNKVEVVRGDGRLDGAGRVVVQGEKPAELEAGAVVVASGSRVRSLPGLDLDGAAVISSDDALRRDSVPASAIVLGAGAVGVEFASLYRSFGAEVTLVEVAERLVPLEDDDVGAVVRRVFEKRGIRCLAGARLEPASLERNEGGVAVTAVVDGKEERLQAEVLLVAVGRAANVEDVGLESAGVAVERGFVTVDASQRTSAAGVYAIGDVAGGFLLAHKGSHEGIVTAEVIAGEHPHPVESRLVPRTTYCTPQIGSIGLSEREARERGMDVRTGTMPVRGNGRALIWGETEGFCKVVADAATDSVVGVHIVGPEVTELVAGPALGALLEVTPFELSRAIAPHPTLSELVTEAAMAVGGAAIHI